ncbi:MAG TPA: dihydroorotate dehydrogenase, partial [Planctomycetota bacterium]|nr:dihydroorotate dehydrogenase [Planctomycetota bacterium]
MRSEPDVKLGVKLAGLELSTPMLVASGTYGWGTEFDAIEDFASDRIGGILLKGTTLEPREGNRTPRIVETAGGAGILNSIGLENPGAE